jgi:hypothetical protein
VLWVRSLPVKQLSFKLVSSFFQISSLQWMTDSRDFFSSVVLCCESPHLVSRGWKDFSPRCSSFSGEKRIQTVQHESLDAFWVSLTLQAGGGRVEIGLGPTSGWS